MRDAQGRLRTGLITDEVQVTFNIAASGDQSGGLKVEMTPVSTGPAASGELSTKYTAQRGNQITIKFKNILTANLKDTVCTDPKYVANFKDMVTYISSQADNPDGPVRLK